jgi:hypothetical protein
MAREAGARNVYFASAAPPVKYPNVYGIDMPVAGELVANNRSTDQVCHQIGADWLIYQELGDLVDAVREGKINDPELAAKRNRRFGPPFCEIMEAGAPPSGKYQCKSLTSETTDETLGRLHSCFPEENLPSDRSFNR